MPSSREPVGSSTFSPLRPLARFTGVGLLLLVLFASCSGTDPAAELTLVRVENGTDRDVEELTVFTMPPIEADLLEAGAVTGYREVEEAFRIATVHVRIEDVPHILQIVDHVGESPLGPGLYTYRLELEGGPGPSLSLELVEDG